MTFEARISQVEALPSLREVIAQYSLSAQKSLGQNFLLDMNITDKIVRASQDRYNVNWGEVHALEVGPGPGGLTRSLLKSGVGKVTAIELDERAIVALDGLREAACGDLDIISRDAMQVDLTQIACAPRIIVANLPYNIATPLLLHWLKQIRADQDAYASMTLMFQKEVAERICAKAHTKSYGRLSIMAQWLCGVDRVYNLPPSAFTPPPKVESSVVHFIPKKLPDQSPEFAAVERVTAAAFQQRRKMIRSSLKAYMPAIEALGIDPTKRAENLSLQEFLSIAGYQN